MSCHNSDCNQIKVLNLYSFISLCLFTTLESFTIYTYLATSIFSLMYTILLFEITINMFTSLLNLSTKSTLRLLFFSFINFYAILLFTVNMIYLLLKFHDVAVLLGSQVVPLDGYLFNNL